MQVLSQLKHVSIKMKHYRQSPTYKYITYPKLMYELVVQEQIGHFSVENNCLADFHSMRTYLALPALKVCCDFFFSGFQSQESCCYCCSKKREQKKAEILGLGLWEIPSFLILPSASSLFSWASGIPCSGREIPLGGHTDRSPKFSQILFPKRPMCYSLNSFYFQSKASQCI